MYAPVQVWYYSICDVNMEEGAGSSLSKTCKFVEADYDSPLERLEIDPSSNTQVLLNNIPLVSCAVAQKKKKMRKKEKALSVVKTPDPMPQSVDTTPKTSQNNLLVEAVQSIPFLSDEHVLQPKHKIFLSHSGVQKDFVEELCEDLEKRHHFPFFDKRPLSLPQGERFPKLILDAAKQCRMAVVVVSNDYFVSRWPMIELHEFVQALESTNTKLRILPLFYGLSVVEFCDPSRQDEWFKLWDDWAEVDKRVNVKRWKYALKVLRSFKGIEYKQFMRNGAAYRRTIVSDICLVLPPDIKWDDSHVQGRSKLCEVLHPHSKLAFF